MHPSCNPACQVDELGRFLRGSSWFHRSHGGDHMLLSTDYHAAESMRRLGASGLTRRVCYATQVITATSPLHHRYITVTLLLRDAGLH